ncbi:MAG TPA: hypothetical protein VGQ83_26420 [Polyangia bacterium]
MSVFVLALAACGGPLKFNIKGTPKAPDLDCKIQANVADEQGITLLQMQLDHLAPPDRFASGATHFVAWSKGGESYNRVGALKYDKDKRTGALEATSPDVSFVLIITAEGKVNPAAPSTTIILEQKIAK